MTLQGNLLGYLGKDYSTLVLAIETMWKEVIIDLANTILRIICPAKINKKNKKNTINNVNALAVGV